MAAVLNQFYKALANAEYFAVLILVFLASALIVGACLFLFTRRDIVRARFDRFVTSRPVSAPTKSRIIDNDEEGKGFVTRIATSLSRMLTPKDETDLRGIRLKMMQAGFHSGHACRIYLASKVLCGILFPLAYICYLFFFTFSLQAILVVLLLAGLGFLVPTWTVWHLASRRKSRISRALPDALDLMVVCAEAGLGLDMTFMRVGQEIRPLSNELSDEFFLANLEIRAGKERNESFQNMAQRTGVQEVKNLMVVLNQAGRFGTSIAKALRVHADAMRISRRQKAELKASKLPVKMVFPLLCFIFPALIIVLVGPATLQIMKTLLPMFKSQVG